VGDDLTSDELRNVKESTSTKARPKKDASVHRSTGSNEDEAEGRSPDDADTVSTTLPGKIDPQQFHMLMKLAQNLVSAHSWPLSPFHSHTRV
jgi:hypothetical protein